MVIKDKNVCGIHSNLYKDLIDKGNKLSINRRNYHYYNDKSHRNSKEKKFLVGYKIEIIVSKTSDKFFRRSECYF